MDRAVNRHPERRSFPRPPLWLNLLLLIIAAATFAYARHQRQTIDDKLAVVFRPSPNSPEELMAIREELAQTDLNRAELAKELDGRLKYLDAINSEQFYIAIDTAKKRMQFRIGRNVARECAVEIGDMKTITSREGKKWTFIPLKGGFNVAGKETDYAWAVPDWLFAMQGQSPPATRPVIANGLGKYVVVLQNNYVIHSPPPPESPLRGPKPGSYMVPEADLAAIWPRITTETRVYIF